MKELAFALALSVFGNVAVASPEPVNSNCPLRSPGHVWSDYFLHKYAGGSPPFIWAGLTFDGAKRLTDRHKLGAIDIDACYKVTYYLDGGRDHKKGWSSQHSTRTTLSPSGVPSIAFFEQATQYMDGLPGDPQKGEINVAGTLLTFDNKSGLVRDPDGNKVGQLQCFTMPDHTC